MKMSNAGCAMFSCRGFLIYFSIPLTQHFQNKLTTTMSSSIRWTSAPSRWVITFVSRIGHTGGSQPVIHSLQM